MVHSTNNVIRKQKRKPGRPKKEGGPAKLIALRLPPDTLSGLQRWAEANGTDRTGAIREAVEQFLKRSRRATDFREAKAQK
jgi:uncharacterized protein (DUF4415 family)